MRATDTLFSVTHFKALLAKELHEIFSSFTAYVVIAVFLAVVAYTFTSVLFFQRSVTVIHALAQAASLMILLVPVVTMRQFSRERETGTFELLLSTPSGELEIVLAKYFSSLILVSVMIVLSLSFPLALALLGSPDYGAIASAYIGLFLLSAAYVALGLCVAAFINNPIVAALVSFAIFASLWMVELANYILPVGMQYFTESLSFDIHFSRFLAGAVFYSDCTYFLMVVLGSLLICVQRVSYR